MPKTTLTIATRTSLLALWQAEHIQARLRALYPDLDVELLGIKTQGDKILDVPLAKIGGKGLFVKELEQAMLDGRADIAVHSMKDVPMEFPKGLGLAVICEREDPRDAFVSNRFDGLNELPEGAVVGTSSLRRQCQLQALRPDLQVRTLRGNVQTRLRKLDDGEFDAIILAASGLIRLELGQRIRQSLAPEVSLPACGQGALGIETRLGDTDIHDWLAPLAHQETTLTVTAERAFNQRLQGGCQVPIAGYAELTGSRLRLRGLVGEPDGSTVLYDECEGPSSEAEALGRGLADTLLARGAGAILQRVYGSA